MNASGIHSSDLKQRTKVFALRILRLWMALPRRDDAMVIGKQLLRSGTSVGANYRAACRSKSHKDFLNKIRICVEEADESCYWMELLIEQGLVESDRLNELLDEANQLTAILTASAITTERNPAKQHGTHSPLIPQ